MNAKLWATALFASIVPLAATAAITGTVINPDGQPIAAARVSIFAPETELARRERLISASPDRIPIASVQADAKGNFTIPSPKEAVVSLGVSARGFEPQQRLVERDEELGALLLTKAEMKTVTVTAAGKPVSAATVSVRYDGFEWTTRSDDHGRAEVPDLRRANNITVIHPDFAIDSESFSMIGRPSADKLRRALITGTSRTGKVLEADGKTPSANAKIYVDGWPAGSTGEDGSFTIHHTPAKWTMVVARQGNSFGQRAWQPAGGLSLRLTKGASISGRVIDSKSRVPVPSAQLSAFTRRMDGPAADFPVDTTTDAKGAFVVQVPAGTYQLAVSHPAYASQSFERTVTTGEHASRDVAVNPLARVSGSVVDEDGKPVVLAQVSAEQGIPIGFMGARAPRDENAVMTTPEGRFSLRMTGERDSRLRAAKKGFPIANTEALHLSPGDRKTGVLITIPNGIAVSGRAVDAEGNPLAGVTVTPSEGERGGRAMRMIMIGGSVNRDDLAVRTGSDGRFAMRVKEGTWDFTFRLDGYASQVVRGQKIAPGEKNEIEASMDLASEISGRVMRGDAPVAGVVLFSMGGNGDGSSATSGPDGSFVLSGLSEGQVGVSVRKADEMVQEMRMLRAPARDVVIELPEGQTLSGRVTEKGSNQPVTSFQVGVSISRGGGGMVMMAPPLMRAFTSDDGSFVLEHVPVGAVNLVASAPGFSTARMNLHVDEGKDVEDLKLELDHGVRLFGKVTAANGSPVPDAEVRLTTPGGPPQMGAGDRTTTDANGDYSLDSLEAGERSIQVRHDSLGSATKSASLKGREVRLDIQLDAGMRLTGTVATESGAPVSDADVLASGGGRSGFARSSADGSFEIEGLQPGRYNISASKSGFAEGKVTDFDVSSGAPVRIILKNGGAIFGRVTGLDLRSYPDSQVRVTGNGTFLSSSIDSAGNYRIEGVPTGTVQVSAVAMSRGFAGSRTSQAQTVDVETGASRQVDIVFGDETVVTGRVSRNGTPLSGAMVSFIPKTAGTQTTANATTDDRGNYEIEGLADGEYSVGVIDLQRFSPYYTTTTIRGGGTFDIDYTAQGLRGRVVDSSTNDPVSGASIDLRSTSTVDVMRASRTVVTDANGTFAIDFVSPGGYMLTATKKGYGNEVRDIQIGSSGSDDLELRLSRSDGVSFKIVDARDGNVLRGFVTVFDQQDRVLYDGRMGSMFGTSGEDQRVSLSPGSYRAAVSASGYATKMISFNSPGAQTVGLTPGGTILLESRQPSRRRIQLIDANGIRYYGSGSRNGRFDLYPDPGTTTLQNIAAGSYTVQLLSEDESTVVDSVVLNVPEGGVVKGQL